MTRRALLAPALGMTAAACSSLRRPGAHDGGARCVAHDQAYGEHPRQRYDLYAPVGRGRWPTLVFFYGDVWGGGERGLYGGAALTLAARGFLVAVPDYRRVPATGLPAFVQDAARAVARVGRIAGDHGGDSRRLGVVGHSAGAYLALMIALDRRYMVDAGSPGLIRAAAGLAGPCDARPQDVASTHAAFGQMRDATLTQPVAFARRDAPPVWMGHGTADAVHGEAFVLLDRAMKRAGAASTLKFYPDLSHADMGAAPPPLFRRKAPVLDDVTRFFHAALT